MKTAAFMLCTCTPARGWVISDTQKPVSWGCKRRFRQRRFRHRVAPTLRARSPPRNRKADKLSSLNDDTVSRIGALLMRNRRETGQWLGEINLQFAEGDPLERALRIATRAATGYSRDVGRFLKLPSTVRHEDDSPRPRRVFRNRTHGKKPETAALSANNLGRMAERERGLTRERDASILPVHGRDRR